MKPDLLEVEQLRKTNQNYLPESYKIQKGHIITPQMRPEKVTLSERVEGYKIFIDLFQKKNRAPARFSHSLTISIDLFIECCQIGIIDTKHLCSEGIAFFVFTRDNAVISFDRFYIANDIHIRILEHVVFRKTGEIPVKRNAKSKLDEDVVDINEFAERVIKGK